MHVTALASPFAAPGIAGPAAAYKNTAAAPAAAAASASTAVTLSAAGRLAAQVDPAAEQPFGELLLPTRADAAKLAQQAGDMVSAKLAAAGIAAAPPFDLLIEDVNSAHVTVKGDRPDAKAIEKLLNDDQELQLAVHNAHALASHIPALEKAAAFAQEYAAAQSQAEIDRVLARYSALFDGAMPPAEVGLRFDEAGLTARINGEIARA